jgi:hypothetical protein
VQQKRPGQAGSRAAFFDQLFYSKSLATVNASAYLLDASKDILKLYFGTSRNNDGGKFTSSGDSNTLPLGRALDNFGEFLFCFKQPNFVYVST